MYILDILETRFTDEMMENEKHLFYFMLIKKYSSKYIILIIYKLSARTDYILSV